MHVKDKSKISAFRHTVLHLCAWITVLYAVLLLVSWPYLLSTHNPHVGAGKYPVGRQQGVYFLFTCFAIACVGYLTRWLSQPHLVRTTAVWLLGWSLPDIPILVHNIGPAVCGAEPDHFTEGITLGYVVSVSVYMAFLVGIAMSADVSGRTNCDVRTQRHRLDKLSTGLLPSWLFTFGIIGLSLSIALRYSLLPGVVQMLIGGTILIMGGQCLLRRSFIMTSALSMSALLVVSGPIGCTTIRTAEMWAVPVILGLLSLRYAKESIALRVAALIVPLMFLILSCVVPWVIPNILIRLVPLTQ
jgi:hypothetical protein